LAKAIKALNDWYHGIVIPWHHDTMIPCNHGAFYSLISAISSCYMKASIDIVSRTGALL
jgi:hypothetical protein